MGLFLQNHQNYDKYAGNRTVSPNYGQNYYNCEFGFGELLVSGLTQGASIFFQAWDADGKGGSDDELDPETQKKVDAKEQELQELLSANGIENEKGLPKKIKSENKHLEKITKDLQNLNTSFNSLQSDLSALNSEYSSVADKINQLKKFSATKGNDTDYNNQLAALNKKLQSIQEKINRKNDEISELNKKIIDKNNELDTQQAELLRLMGVSAQAENIVNEIFQLQGESLTHNVDYDIEQETEDLSRFNTALKSFPKNGATQDDVDKIINAFNGNQENSETVVNQRHAITAIKLIKMSNPDLDWSKLNVA